MSKPTFVYKLVPASAQPPDPLPDSLPVSNIDQASGFVHLSTAVQVKGTLNYFFKDDKTVYILRIPYDAIDAKVKWEDPKAEVCGPRGGEGLFPHLYNGLKLGKDEVESVALWEKLGDTWDTAVNKAEHWLVY